jgi:hypothetical protein
MPNSRDRKPPKIEATAHLCNANYDRHRTRVITSNEKAGRVFRIHVPSIAQKERKKAAEIPENIPEAIPHILIFCPVIFNQIAVTRSSLNLSHHVRFK